MLDNRFKDTEKDIERKVKKATRTRMTARIVAVLLPIIFKLVAVLVIVSVAVTLVGGFVKIIRGEVFQWAATSTDKLEELQVINTEERCLDLSNDVIDELIKQLIDNGLDVAKLKMLGDETDLSDKTDEEITEAMRKYIREYYAAELVTQYPDMDDPPGQRKGFLGLVDRGIEGISKWMGRYQGCIRLVKSDDNGNVTFDENGNIDNENYLTYISEEEFEKKLEDALAHPENSEHSIKEHFTVSGNNIKVVGWTTTSVGETTSTTYYTTSLNFKAIASAYTMPMEFLLMVNLYSENPEFTYALAKMVENSQIVLAVQHNYSMNEQIVDTKTQYWIEESTKTTETKNADGTVTTTTTTIPAHWSGVYTTSTTTIVKSYTPSVQLVLADTWIVKKQVEYTKKDVGPETDVDYQEFNNADSKGSITTTTTTQSYNYVESGSIEEEKTKLVLGLLRNAEGIYNEENLLEFEPEKRSQMKYVRYKIPNTIVERSPSGNLVSGAKMMIDDLEKNESTQNQAEIMKYLMYVYTGIDQYGGATEFDQLKDLFVTKTFEVTSNGGSLLIQMIHALEGEPKEDGNGNYIAFDDGAGTPTIGWGVTRVEGNEGYFDSYGIFDLQIGDVISKEIIDSIEVAIRQDKIAYVESETNNLNLKPYQKDALTIRAYNYNVSGFSEAYNAYWNESDDMYGETSDRNAVKNHPLYTNYMSKPVTSKGEYLGGIEDQREMEWLLFRTGYYTKRSGEIIGIWKEGNALILEKAYEISDYMRKNQYAYCLNGGEKDPTHDGLGGLCGLDSSFQASKTGHHLTCCATYVSWVLQEAGYDIKCCHGVKDLYNNLSSTFSVVHLYEELQAGDIVFTNNKTHVQIYAGDGMWYNAGGNESIRRLSYPYTDNVKAEFTIALRSS